MNQRAPISVDAPPVDRFSALSERPLHSNPSRSRRRPIPLLQDVPLTSSRPFSHTNRPSNVCPVDSACLYFYLVHLYAFFVSKTLVAAPHTIRTPPPPPFPPSTRHISLGHDVTIDGRTVAAGLRPFSRGATGRTARSEGPAMRIHRTLKPLSPSTTFFQTRSTRSLLISVSRRTDLLTWFSFLARIVDLRRAFVTTRLVADSFLYLPRSQCMHFPSFTSPARCILPKERYAWIKALSERVSFRK